MSRDINVALVGFGLAGRSFHAPLVVATAGMRLHTVVSSRAEQVHAEHPQARVAATPEAAFADRDIDLVVIATPNELHAPLALAALEHGKHVVVDKPFALDLAQAHAIVAQARRANRIASVFQNRRWDSDFLTLRRLIAAGTLGEVAECHSHFDRCRPVVADRWRERDTPGAGLWFDLGPHLLDQALQLFGMPRAVFADLARQREGAQVDDYFHVQLRYARLRVVLHGGSLVPAAGLRFAVHGTRASYVKHGLDPQEQALRGGTAPGGPGWGEDPQPGHVHVHRDGPPRVEAVAATAGDYGHYYRAMRSAIVESTAPPVTTDEALALMAVLERAVQSARERREVGCEDLEPQRG